MVFWRRASSSAITASICPHRASPSSTIWLAFTAAACVVRCASSSVFSRTSFACPSAARRRLSAAARGTWTSRATGSGRCTRHPQHHHRQRRQRLLSSLSALGGARGRIAAARASQIIWGPSGGQTNGGACRDRIGGARGARLERLVEREDVPGGDQDLARDGGLGRVGLAVAALDVGVEAVPRIGRPPGVLGGFDGGPAQGRGTGLGQPTGVRALAGLLDARPRPA
jgi:hypothetical protein